MLGWSLNCYQGLDSELIVCVGYWGNCMRYFEMFGCLRDNDEGWTVHIYTISGLRYEHQADSKYQYPNCPLWVWGVATETIKIN